jgi:hypothetical protein
MKGYIYTMYAGADPGHGWVLNDPIFTPIPTLGACVPNIRRNVEKGDYIFAISGRVPGERQFVVGGFKVAEKIHALAAYERFPQYRVKESTAGLTLGNIIVDSDGSQSQLDHHLNFERRLDNYIVGADPKFLETNDQFDRAREGTLGVLGDVFGKHGNRVFDIVGRQRKMDAGQVQDLLGWLEAIKQ